MNPDQSTDCDNHHSDPDLESRRLRSINNRVRGDSGQDLESHRLRSIDKSVKEDSNKDIDDDPNLQIVTRSGKVAGLNSIKKNSKGFGHSAALVNALHIEHNQGSTSLGIPAVPFESLTLEQALLEDKLAWEASLLDELRSLEKNNTFEIIEGNYKSTNGRKLISSRWVLRNKFNSDGSIARRKARIVGKGYEQQHGIDYFETFATVIRSATLRAIFSYAAFHDLELDHLDVDIAFLNPTLKEPNYMKIPEYFHLLAPWIQGIENNFYPKLRNAFYGLKQSPREWFLEVKKFFNDMGFKQGDADPNLFISSPMGEKGDRVYILLFVDDMLIAGSRLLVEEVKQIIMKRWKSKNLGPVETFVGFQVKRNRANRTLTIHQEFYTRKLLERLGMGNFNGVSTPIASGTVLKERDDDELLEEDNAALYRQIVGSTISLSNGTRPDISYAVDQLARFMAKPRQSFLSHAKHLLRYLQRTAHYGINYSPDHSDTHANNVHKSNAFDIYSDATWGTEDDRKSFQGYVVVYNGGAISWTSQRQKSTALSSMEAEIIAASEGAKEAA
ncbi:hypothetical protein K3495_g10653 [Podosphaera aphanis]|nr:hypothetical protein K3495_g10653 [Podosphaera aphanis]